MKTQSITPSPHYFEAFNICSGPRPFLSLWWFTLPYRKGCWHIFETLDYLHFPNFSLQAPVRPLSGKITFTLHIPAYHHKSVFSISSTMSGISLFLPGCHPTYSSSSTEGMPHQSFSCFSWGKKISFVVLEFPFLYHSFKEYLKASNCRCANFITS